MKNLTKSIVLIATLLAFNACKKNDSNGGNNATTNYSKITKIIEINTGQQDTTEYDFTYNSDSTVSKIYVKKSYTFSNIYFTHTAQYILINTVDSFAHTNQTDTAFLNADHTIANWTQNIGLQSPMVQDFFYNNQKELVKTIYLTVGFIDTITHVWSNGDMKSQSSPTGNFDMTFTYDYSKYCQSGDYNQVDALINFGIVAYPNTHLALNGEVYPYHFNSENKIDKWINVDAGNTTVIRKFQY